MPARGSVDRAFALENDRERPTAEASIRLSLLSKNYRQTRPQDSATAALDFARVVPTIAATGFSSLGELRVSFGLLLLRLPARSGYDSGAGEGI